MQRLHILMLLLVPLIGFALENTSEPSTHLQQLVARSQRLAKEVKVLQQQLAGLRALPSDQNTGMPQSMIPNRPVARSIIHVPHPKKAPKLTRINGANQELKILQQQQHAEASGSLAEHLPRIEVGGEMVVSTTTKLSYLGEKTSDLSLTGADLSWATVINPWVTSMIQLNYNSGIAARDSRTSISRVANSKVYLSKGFVTLGRLSKSPFYASLGQMTVPFGDYVSYSGTPSLTARLGRTLQRTLLVGYQAPGKIGWQGSVFVFKGDTQIVNNHSLQNGGMDLNYRFASEPAGLQMGLSYLNNIADSGGMQNTYAPFWGMIDYSNEAEEDEEPLGPIIIPTFNGFGSSQQTEQLQHTVPAINVRAKLHVKPWLVSADYTGSLRAFDVENLSFNDQGAKPAAYNMEAAYQFKLRKYMGQLGIGYSHSQQALALNMPKDSYRVGLKWIINKQLTASLNYRYDRNYKDTDYATGQLMPIANADELNKNSQLIMAKLGFSLC